jgi:hypothetical protein
VTAPALPPGIRAAGDVYSVLDILAKVRGTPFPSSYWPRLVRRFPFLRELVVYRQFPGRRQNLTPAIAGEHLPKLLEVLALKNPLARRAAPAVEVRAAWDDLGDVDQVAYRLNVTAGFVRGTLARFGIEPPARPAARKSTG